MAQVYNSKQATSLDPVLVTTTNIDTSCLVGDGNVRSVRLQAVICTSGGVQIKDNWGNEIFSGSALTLTSIKSGHSYVTVTSPLKYTVAHPGKQIYLYGEFI